MPEAEYQGTHSTWGRHKAYTQRMAPGQGVPGAEMCAPEFTEWDDDGQIIPACVICEMSGLKVDKHGRCERCVAIVERSRIIDAVNREGETPDGDGDDSGPGDGAPDDVAVPERKTRPKKGGK